MSEENYNYPKGKDFWTELPIYQTADRLEIGEWQVMQAWEFPVMKAMAGFVSPVNGDVLELGFGMAISADEIVRCGVNSYTVIEAHPQIAETARRWGSRQEIEVNVIEGFWQDCSSKIDTQYDGILFDIYPTKECEWDDYHLEFFPEARRLLKDGGAFTYFAGQAFEFAEDHMLRLREHFDNIVIHKIEDLEPPEDCDYFTDNHMLIPVAR